MTRYLSSSVHLCEQHPIIRTSTAACSWRTGWIWLAEVSSPPPSSPHAVTNYSKQCFPSWWITVHCASRTDPHLPWDGRWGHPDSELYTTHNLDNYFHRWIPLQAGWWSGHLCCETITCKHRAPSLSLQRNLVLNRPLSSVSLQLAFFAHTCTFPTSHRHTFCCSTVSHVAVHRTLK